MFAKPGENNLFIKLGTQVIISMIAFSLFSPLATSQNAEVKFTALVFPSLHMGWLWPDITKSSTNQTTILWDLLSIFIIV